VAVCNPCEVMTLGAWEDDDYEWKNHMNWSEVECNGNKNITDLEAVDQDVFFISGEKEPVFDTEKFGEDGIACLAWQHCKQDEMVSPEKAPDNLK